ncbi:MAG TPA: DoxX family protein [Polyangiaceae bacterium]
MRQSAPANAEQIGSELTKRPPLVSWRQLLTISSDKAHDAALLVLRVTFGVALALAHGYGKAVSPERFLQGLTTRGFPLPGLFGWAAIASELLGGLLLALGLLTRPAAALVLITLSVAAFDIHAADPFAKRELALAYVSVALAILIAGPGRFSLDRRLAGAQARL